MAGEPLNRGAESVGRARHHVRTRWGNPSAARRAPPRPVGEPSPACEPDARHDVPSRG
jgi:hypothetical protein